MKDKTFIYFLQKHFTKENPQILDDDLPDAFDDWFTELNSQEVADYAEEWGKNLRPADTVSKTREDLPSL